MCERESTKRRTTEQNNNNSFHPRKKKDRPARIGHGVHICGSKHAAFCPAALTFQTSCASPFPQIFPFAPQEFPESDATQRKFNVNRIQYAFPPLELAKLNWIVPIRTTTTTKKQKKKQPTNLFFNHFFNTSSPHRIIAGQIPHNASSRLFASCQTPIELGKNFAPFLHRKRMPSPPARHYLKSLR